MLAFDPAVARTIFRKYFGPDEERWDPRFREDIEGETGVPLIRFTPETVVLRDQSYKPPRGETAMWINPVEIVGGEITRN